MRHITPTQFSDKSISSEIDYLNHNIWIYCETSFPASAKGASAAIFLTEEMATQLILQLKRDLIELRRIDETGARPA